MPSAGVAPRVLVPRLNCARGGTKGVVVTLCGGPLRGPVGRLAFRTGDQCMTFVKTLLAKLNLGTSVAEFDEDLENYFVETNVFREFVRDKVDIIAGDKGTGKTAIYRFINKQQRAISQLDDVMIIPAFDPSGNPIFTSLTSKNVLSEAEYVLLWKSYILTLVGNTIIENNSDLVGTGLDRLLIGLNLKITNPNPKSVFRKTLDKMPNFFRWKSAEVAFTITDSGAPVFTPKVEFQTTPGDVKLDGIISAEDALSVLNDVLAEHDTRVWIMFDRLDEAFQGHPELEVTALRGLLRTYLDLTEFDNLKLKLFLRKDLFRRITSSGFVNLTHVNARKIEIIWDEDDLLNLLVRRIRENKDFMAELGLVEKTDREIFDVLFPDQVDFGDRKPKTWVWMMRRVRDGNDVKPPRNLIDLIRFSREAQLRKEERDPREVNEEPLFEADSLRNGLSKLSETRVNDTLLAEAGSFAPLIARFRDGKAEHNPESLSEVLEVKRNEIKQAVKPLIELGFLEEIKGNYKIPTLYREGLGVTQGKAFSSLEDEDV